ncbi:MAG: hypothetical protein WB810_09100 [Candidatus Cybelea sp.]
MRIVIAAIVSVVAFLVWFYAPGKGVRLDSIISGHYPVAQFYPAAGAFVELVYNHGATTAVKALFDCGPTVDDFRAGAERLLGEPWDAIAREWREVVFSYATSSGTPRGT